MLDCLKVSLLVWRSGWAVRMWAVDSRSNTKFGPSEIYFYFPPYPCLWTWRVWQSEGRDVWFRRFLIRCKFDLALVKSFVPSKNGDHTHKVDGLRSPIQKERGGLPSEIGKSLLTLVKLIWTLTHYLLHLVWQGCPCFLARSLYTLFEFNNAACALYYATSTSSSCCLGLTICQRSLFARSSNPRLLTYISKTSARSTRSPRSQPGDPMTNCWFGHSSKHHRCSILSFQQNPPLGKVISGPSKPRECTYTSTEFDSTKPYLLLDKVLLDSSKLGKCFNPFSRSNINKYNLQ